MSARKPDYKLSVVVGANNYIRVGAAWVNETGTISIQLDPYIQLPVQSENLKLMLIPTDYKKPSEV